MRGVVGAIASVAVLVAVVIGIVLLGSPDEERARRLDQRRVEDLGRIAQAADLYWTRRGSLPPSLDDLLREPGGSVRGTDPDSGDTYEYRPLDPKRFELCAAFERDSSPRDGMGGDPFWSHGAGRQCFQREAREIR